MIDLEQLVEISWGTSNKNWYVDRGYNFTKMGDKFLVKAKDLSYGSRVRVRVTCDICGEVNIIRYSGYIKNISNGSYTCFNCTNRNKAQSRKTSWDTVKKLFIDKGYTLLSKFSEYKNQHSSLSFICNKHKDAGVQNTTLDNIIRNINNCRTCSNEAMQGENNNYWKGGLSNLNDYMRDKIIVWKVDSMKSCDYKCVLTGDKFDNIHHLQGFNLIIKEVFEENGFEFKENIGDYTEEDLEILVNHVIATHYKYPLGICLRKDLHTLFHRLYGAGDNVPEQFYEFRDRYNNGEFNEILSCN